MLSLAQASTCASSTRLPQGSARNASPWLMTASSTSPGLTTIEWPVLLTDFSVRDGVARFLHDSAGFVGCCLALCRGHHRRRGHAKGRQHVLDARELLANLSMCRTSGQLDPVECFPLDEVH